MRFLAGMAFVVVLLLAGYGVRALIDDMARIEHGRVVTALLKDILDAAEDQQ